MIKNGDFVLYRGGSKGRVVALVDGDRATVKWALGGHETTERTADLTKLEKRTSHPTGPAKDGGR